MTAVTELLHPNFQRSSSPHPVYAAVAGRSALERCIALPNPRDNRLLAALSDAACFDILPALEGIALKAGQVLYESGGAQRYVYFPTSSVVALVNVLENGAAGELAMTGNDGVVGISFFMGGETTTYRAEVLRAGYAYRLSGALLKQAFERGGKLQQLLLRYTQALITQMTQTAVCNRHHVIEQQLCRWLLLNLDRAPSNDLAMTQELIAHMLGVRREGVTDAAGKLQKRGAIQYRRGHITVLDRTKLEASACECYAAVKREYDRLIPAAVLPQSILRPHRRHAPAALLRQPAGTEHAASL